MSIKTVLFILFVSLSLKSFANIKQTDCTACHQQQTTDWQKSDHAQAMLKPSSTAIKADLNKDYQDEHGNHFKLIKEADNYTAIITESGKQSKHEVVYTFGYFPLQQFLIKGEKGRLQVLPYSWDNRSEKQGGQRWFYLYQDIVKDVTQQSRFHWQQPLQNWNGMCADCHSSELTRNFDDNKNQFSTQYSEINVGCLSCHQPHEKNIKSADKNSKEKTGSWLRNSGDKVAKWVGPKRHAESVENCFSCHSLREPLTDGFSAGGKYLDKHSPNLLDMPFYYADGQIKDEVYVYGSFKQSKMAQQGVLCMDCHDKHTMKIKVQADGLCLTCHAPETYFTTEHNKHNSLESAPCVDCHMPETTYMGVDKRRDHSFIVPNSPLTATYESPDVCLSCHQQKNSEWAISSYKKLYGKVPARSQSAHTLALARIGKLEDYSQIWSVISDTDLAEIKRASAILLLPQIYTQLSNNELQPYINSAQPLIRLASVQVAMLLSANDKAILLAPLLSDALKAVRIAAAKQLLGIELPVRYQNEFNKTFAELTEVQALSTWRAEGLLNQAELLLNKGEVKKAETKYLTAIQRDPYFAGSYINLAELYRALAETDRELNTYQKALKNGIDSANFNFALGLYYVRNKQLIKSLTSLEKAVKLQAENSQYWYIYLIALKQAGQENQYLIEKQRAIKRFPQNSQILQLP